MPRKLKPRVSKLKWPGKLQVLEMEFPGNTAGRKVLAIQGEEADGRPHFMVVTRSQAAALAATLLRFALCSEWRNVWNEPESERNLYDSKGTVAARVSDAYNHITDYVKRESRNGIEG